MVYEKNESGRLFSGSVAGDVRVANDAGGESLHVTSPNIDAARSSHFCPYL
jgi:hypothetical protein